MLLDQTNKDDYCYFELKWAKKVGGKIQMDKVTDLILIYLYSYHVVFPCIVYSS